MAKQENTSASSPTLRWVATGSTLVALGVHGYLLSQHFKLKYGAAFGDAICDINDTFSCSAVAASRFAEFLGVPMALWGLAANAVLLLLLLWFPLTEDDKKAAARRNLLVTSGAIALASVVMGVISLTALNQFCLFCIAAYVLSFITFGSLWFGLPRSSVSRGSLSGKSAMKFSDFSPLLILAAIAFIGSFIAKDQIGKSYGGGKEVDAAIASFINEWKQAPAREIATVDPLVKGPSREEATMTLVEFADFRCGHCKHAAPTLKAFATSHPDVRVEFQTWPLDGECNTAISQSNGVSCMLSRVAWCTQKNGGNGWAAHDFIFGKDTYMSTTQVEADYPELSKASGVDAAKLKACVDSEEAKSMIRKQAEVGTALNLRGTPTIYVNGKVLPNGQSLPVLTQAHAVARESR